MNTFFFNQTLSNGLTGDEIITVIDPLLTVPMFSYAIFIMQYFLLFFLKAMGLSVNRDRAPMLPLVSKGISIE